jgi:tetratricopeptide (TPR) repeat protein
MMSFLAARLWAAMCVGLLSLALAAPAVAAGLDDAKAALAAEMKGKLDKALTLYSKAIVSGQLSSSHLALAYNNRGYTYNRKGNYIRALADYDQAIALAPKQAYGYINRSVAYEKLGLLTPAVEDARRFVSMAPRKDGEGQKHLKRLEARLAAGPATAEDRQKAEDLAAQGLALKNQGRFGGALDAYCEALRLDVGYVQAINRLAWMAATCKEARFRYGALALELARRAVALSPGPTTRDTLAAAYAESGRFKEAVEAQREVLAAGKRRGMSANSLQDYGKRLDQYRKRQPWRD